jgi:hypothetical protein
VRGMARGGGAWLTGRRKYRLGCLGSVRGVGRDASAEL